MRKLIAKDIIPATKIIAKMEFKEPLKSIFDKAKDGENSLVITELIWAIVENYHKAEQEVYDFLADLEGKTSEEISNLELSDFIGLFKELFNEKNMSFFKSAVQ